MEGDGPLPHPSSYILTLPLPPPSPLPPPRPCLPASALTPAPTLPLPLLLQEVLTMLQHESNAEILYHPNHAHAQFIRDMPW